MKTLIKNILTLILLSGVLFASCKKDFVNTEPLGEVPGDATWSDAPLAEAFVTGIYSGLGQGGFDEQMLASISDEALFTHPGRGINTINESLVSPDNQGWVSGNYSWGNMYGRIRASNIALQQLASPGFNDVAMQSKLQGEAHFLRAYYYQQLLRYYGGVPIITTPYELGEADYTATRNTFEETVNFIIQECDSASLLLDGKNMAKGRATKDAALALKSRVLLYAASDLHDIPTAKAKSSVIAGYTNPELIGYVSGDRAERWRKAKDAARAVLNLQQYAYKMDLGAPATLEEATANYKSLAMGGGSGAPGIDKAASAELIFARYFVAAKNEAGQRIGLFNGPNGYHNWAGNAPVQNLVDDYEMMDGTKFDWSNPQQSATIYENRDPRFYATILYDGSEWKPRTADVSGKDPNNEIQTGEYQTGSSASPSTYFGLDTRNSSVEDWNGTRTGYFMHKFIDPNPAIVDQNTRQNIPWPFLRYTEAVFNYAEACINLGEEAEAKIWLNKIRFRAGMPAITESGTALLERYINERRVEMAYEEQRYHDARRWMIAPATLGQKAGIIKVQATLKPGKSVSIYKYSKEDYNYTYTPQNIDPGIENRQWNDKMYFVPISRDEINRNSKLIQNPGF